MRFVGRISDWIDDKGYGFVVPHDGGKRAFVHVKAFQAGSRRPIEGDLISYETAKDGKGRMKAVNVRFAGQRIESRPPRGERRAPSHRVPRAVMGVLALAAISAAAAMGWMPIVVPLPYALMSVASFLVYWWDKDAAGAKRWRRAEETLHLLDLLGGWPGALIAQQQFRHKTVKTSFQTMFWITVLLNVAGMAWLVRSGAVDALTRWLT